MVRGAVNRLLVGGLLAVLGCGGGAGGADGGSPGTGGTGTGASGAGGAPALDPTPFLGAWTETTTIVATGACANLVDPLTTTAPITVTRGAASDLLRAETTGASCAIPLDLVSSNQATLASSKQCTYASATYDFSAWTMTVNGNAGTESASGTLMGSGINCPVMLTATFSR